MTCNEDYDRRSAFHSCCGYLVVSVDTTVYVGLGYEDVSKKCFITVPIVTLLSAWKSQESEVKVKWLVSCRYSNVLSEIIEK